MYTFKRTTGLIAAGALTAEALMGCSASPPPDLHPDGTYEQIESVTGWGNTLGDLALSQHIVRTVTGELGTPEKVDLFNFTPAKVNPDAVKRIVAYDIALASEDSPGIWRYPIEYLKDDGYNKKVEIGVGLTTDDVSEHDLVLVPDDISPPAEANAGAGTQTMYLPNGANQNVSMIEQPSNDDDNPGSFMTDGTDLYTEIAQNFIAATAVDAAGLPNLNEVGRLAQETFANSVADEEQAAEQGTSYANYSTDEPSHIGEVPVEASDDPEFVGDNYYILDFTFPRSQFAKMTRALLRKAA